jgi:secreted trypsin-like serine protease
MGRSRWSRWGVRLVAALLATPLTLNSSWVAATESDHGPTPRIINGISGESSDFPFLVSVLESPRYRQDGAFRAQFCAGSLTTPLTVVTAAHCVVDQESGARTSPDRIVLGFGSNLKSPTLRVIAAQSIVVHPQYKISTAENDIAVITLAAPVNDIPTVAVLTSDEDDIYIKAGTPARVAGWGNTSQTGDKYPEIFRVGDVVIFPPASCGEGERYTVNGVRFFGFNSKDANSQSMICAAGATKNQRIIDACQGDSGGPLVVGTGTELRLVGAVSWGETCASKYPGVYTRLSAEGAFLTAAGAVAIPPPASAPTLSITPLNGSLQVRITASDTDRNISSYAATATDIVNGTSYTCFAAPTRKNLAGTCTITGLTNGSAYSITGFSANPFGNSPVSEPVVAAPSDQPIAGAITRVTVTGDDAQFLVRKANQNGATLAWNRVVCTAESGKVRYSAIRGTSVTIKNLTPGVYQCSTRIMTDAGVATSSSVPLDIPTN